MKILFTTLLIVLFSFQLVFSQGGSNMSVNLLRNSSDSGDYFSPGDVLNTGTQDFTIEVKMLYTLEKHDFYTTQSDLPVRSATKYKPIYGE